MLKLLLQNSHSGKLLRATHEQLEWSRNCAADAVKSCSVCSGHVTITCADSMLELRFRTTERPLKTYYCASFMGDGTTIFENHKCHMGAASEHS